MLPLLTMLVSVAFVATQPRTYQATAGMWFQSNATAADFSRPSADASTPPANAAIGVFRELLNARTFCLKVGHRGPLGAYLSDPSHAPQDPVSRLSSLVGGSSARSQQSVDDNVVYLLQHSITVNTSGPHIVTLAFTFGDAKVAAATLQALLDQFSDEVLAAVRTQQTLSKTQVDDRLKQVQDAETAVSKYYAAHPELRTPNVAPDPVLDGLQQAANQARLRYSDAQSQYDQLRLQSDTSNFRVVDRPTPPPKPVSRTSALVLGVLAGLGTGLLLSFMVVVLLVLGDRTLSSEADIEQSLGIQAAGSVPLVKGRRGLLRRRRGATA
jgi:uncharacterized protein involved in exopolysaccharide biosynthesis